MTASPGRCGCRERLDEATATFSAENEGTRNAPPFTVDRCRRPRDEPPELRRGALPRRLARREALAKLSSVRPLRSALCPPRPSSAAVAGRTASPRAGGDGHAVYSSRLTLRPDL